MRGVFHAIQTANLVRKRSARPLEKHGLVIPTKHFVQDNEVIKMKKELKFIIVPIIVAFAFLMLNSYCIFIIGTGNTNILLPLFLFTLIASFFSMSLGKILSILTKKQLFYTYTFFIMFFTQGIFMLVTGLVEYTILHLIIGVIGKPPILLLLMWTFDLK